MSLTKEQQLKQIEASLHIPLKKIKSVIELTEEGNTVPFIARYRKEMTGALDEVEIQSVLDRWTYLQNLENRKEEVLRLIDEQGKLSDDLKKQIEKALKLQEVEDLYRPYKQKRRTKATIAKERGLQPLADWLLTFSTKEEVENYAQKFISPDKEVRTIEEALEGAADIIAEEISDHPKYREWIRVQTRKEGKIVSAKKKDAIDEKEVYSMYYEYEENINRIVPHRVLALNRGESENVLRISMGFPEDRIIQYLERKMIKNIHAPSVSYVKKAIADGFKRLLAPSIEREIRSELTEVGENQAIKIFSENLRNLLLQPPLKGKMVLGVDPAYRTGCKLAVVDETGKTLEIDVIYPHPPKAKKQEAYDKVVELLQKYNVEVVAIGNGTASRETEQFIADLLKDMKQNIFYLIVNEAGASVYSASALAREEFPTLQVEERSAISIARRLQDPLAELVKIDPKSVGVGQYQHDVSQKKLNESLKFVVETVVNQVGVNLNTASSSLLQYVAGLNKTVANNIVQYREEEGKLINRSQLKKVPRLGAKTYEQCVGFLRILDGKQPLDRTGIHPENYEATKRLLQMMGMTTKDLGSPLLAEKIKELNKKKASQELEIGELTLNDIIDSLQRPERDPRDELPKPLLKQDILKLEDLTQGMELEGTVRNVVDFGAFVDIGVKQDGLVHISKLRNSYVKHPLDVVAVGDLVTVWVESVDALKGRIALSMIAPS
ncbi:Tex family protein [Priestia filamentosa]|uniref:RNA-binding transcriptional accessory protein n=1 Tax=Priestia filamentosa TaxID=1402861 RepID=A0A1X7GFJ3_9BACI|nr:Tex family protein [Priestia filamentosa]AKO90922.1 RNA-binding transcriptional accessory protein [Priestia filamentosa]AVD54260.1 RNA-binding transcriptional accessory protein [Priestia filamentosa]MDT3765986.1 Tex family protein [Priestia filamentosa]OXS65409.1 RNA-binding transcriptional accessory protein [Priestia filamentosa]SMF68867.1 uncharacterized protein SAMN06296056_11088 [Priestia filamentosa]